MRKIDERFWDLFSVVDACFENAYDLIDEARILYRHKRYARSFCSGHYAEE